MKSNAQQLSDLDYRINRARLAGANCMKSQAEFKNYLLEIGLNKYEKSILPVENEGEYTITEPGQEKKNNPVPRRFIAGAGQLSKQAKRLFTGNGVHRITGEAPEFSGAIFKGAKSWQGKHTTA